MHIFPTQLEEAEWIAEKIKEDHARGIPFRSNLLLFRSSMYKKLMDAALIKRNIPVNYVGGTTFMKASHVRDIIAPVRIVHNEDDGMAWIRFLQIFSGIGEESSSSAYEDLREVVGLEAKLTVLHSRHRKFFEPAQALGKIVRQAHLHVKDLLAEIAKVLDPHLEKRYRDEWHTRRQDIPLLQTIAEGEADAASFLENYSLNPLVEYSAKGMETITDKVTLSTVHGAKGNEADIVYVPALMPGHYPPSYAETPEEIEEERRILYVALTRAKRELHLSRPLERGQVYGKRWDDSSMYFLEGMPQNQIGRAHV
jgi:DNA helicase-2/ATP-dependent DNA helicase PcrA